MAGNHSEEEAIAIYPPFPNDLAEERNELSDSKANYLLFPHTEKVNCM